MMRRGIINNADLNPIGFKILLEILVKANYNSVVEVPFVFGLRKNGKSNLSLKEIRNYLIQVFPTCSFKKTANVVYYGVLVKQLSG